MRILIDAEAPDPWLRYVGSLIDPRVEFCTSGPADIAYGAGLSIPRRDRFVSARFRWWRDLPIYESTWVGEGEIPFDLLYNIFIWAAGLEAMSLHSVAPPPLRDDRLWRRPIAEYLIDLVRPRPPGRAAVWLTHDVDAIGRSTIHTAKQAVAVAMERGWRAPARALDFALAADTLRPHDRIRELEGDLPPTVFVYAGNGRARFADPDYRLSDPRVRDLLRRAESVGCHNSIASSFDARMLRGEREALERAAGRPVTAVRQHWLHLLPARALRAQVEAGFTIDASLGFNERWGFRNGLARAFPPYDHAAQAPMPLLEVPMALMDQQLYFNRRLTRAGRRAEIAALLDELQRFGGFVSIDWHTQTMGRAYGWGGGYEEILAMIRDRGIEARVPTASGPARPPASLPASS